MKKISIFFLLSLLFISNFSSAQEQTLGLRFELYPREKGVEITYQRQLASLFRVEGGAGIQKRGLTNFYYGALTLQTSWNLKPSLDWYIGSGAQLGYYQRHYSNTEKNHEGFAWGIPLLIGLEYDFIEKGAPFIFSADFRPIVVGHNAIDNFGRTFGLSLRYKL